jgi:NTE family protein
LKAYLLFIILIYSCQLKANNTKYDNLIFDGSGMRAFAYVGALQVLEQKAILNNIKRVGGTSGGALIATLFSLGYNITELKAIATSVPSHTFNDSRWQPWLGLSKLKRYFGYHHATAFTNWMSKLIANKTGNADITLDQLHQLNHHQRDLYIVVTDVLQQNTLVLSHENFPNMKVIDAVRAAIAIPLFFTPIAIDSTGFVIKNPQLTQPYALLADGGMLCNYPIQIFDSLRFITTNVLKNDWLHNPSTLGINISSTQFIETNKIKLTIKSYIKLLYHTMIDQPVKPNDRYRSIIIDDLDIQPKVRKIKKSTIEALLESGRKGAELFFQNQKK